jgi:hypothetical protein
MSGAISRRQSEIAALHVVRNFRTKGVDRLSPFEYNERMSNRYRYLTADVTWADEKNAGPVSRETAPRRAIGVREVFNGNSQCSDCGLLERPCMCCLECGQVQQRVLAQHERCDVCTDARARHIERELVERMVAP